jgi:IS30 family transposase
MGKNGTSAIGTLVERSTRFVLLLHLGGRRDVPAVAEAMTEAMTTLPAQLRRSLTWDQNNEQASLRQVSPVSQISQISQISLAAEPEIYFSDPRAPWQPGSNENTNGLLRQYFPKDTGLSRHSKDHLEAVAAQLNGRPRKTLDWRTPAEALNDLLGSPPDRPPAASA